MDPYISATANPVIENELEELELLLRQKLEQESRANGQDLYEEEKRKIEKEREIKEEEDNDIEKEEEEEERKRKVVEEEELKEFIEQKNDKRTNRQNLYEEEKKKLEKEREIEEDGEDHIETGEEFVDPDSSLEHLLEAMVIEENGQQHTVQGLHPEKSSKTYGDSHDKHKHLPKQQRDLASRKRRKRNFITDTSKLWEKNIIPYKTHNMSSSSITVINQAIQQFTDTTCVRWVPENTAGSYGLNHQNVVYFINEQGCWSYVGNIGQHLSPQNIQPVSLQEPGCVSVTTTVHEMLHAMGGQHEQSRSDRDNYVRIEWNNVQGGTGNYNMQKLSTQDNNPYDAESSMQYALYSFSTNGQKTILFRDQRLEFLADIADGLEFYDIQDVTDAYHCADHCSNPPACENGGFVNFQCVCVCPDGLTGATCTDTVSNSPTCGGVVTLGQGEENFIQSPNYPSNYPTGLECTWLIKVPAGNLVRATVEYMDIATGTACYHWLEYRYNLLGQTGPKRCGTNFNAGAEIWDSTSDELGNVMMIKFNSNVYSNNAGTKGFRLKVQSIGTGCVVNPCVYGTCVTQGGSSAYTCTCDSGVSGQNCDVLTASSTIGCSFEYGEKCFLDNDSGDQFDWSSASGATPSSGTGPSNAHGGYQFYYIETSSPRVQGDKAVLVNNQVTLISGPRCLSFYYHMHGSSIGTLNVYTEGQNVAKSNVFTISGQQGDNWLKGEVDVPAMDNLKIYFEGIRGSSWAGDIALDDILLTPGTCAAPITVATTNAPTNAPTTSAPTTSAPTTSAPTTSAPTSTQTNAPTSPSTNAPTNPPVTGVQSCTFEPGASCFMVDSSDDDFDWTTRTGSTPSSNTGPSQAYEGSHYKYVEVSSPRSNNDEATLVSTTSLTASDYCLIFSYHMFGSSSMGDLVIATGDSSPDNEVFRESGNLGDQWNQGFVDFAGAQNMKLFITANRGTTWKGDIAIDDLQLHNGVCSSIVASCYTNPCQNGGTCTETTKKRMAAGYTCSCLAGFTGSECEFKDLTTVAESTCGFETGEECVFENDDSADFNWDINDGDTPSSGTGPSSAYEGTYYIYMEASSPRVNGDMAILSTAHSKLAGQSTYCLQFYYHMLGNPDTLMVDFGERYSQGSTVWSVSNDQGDQWNYQQVEIDATAVNDPVVSITAVRGSSWKGDIAVDSLVLKMGSCPAIVSHCSSDPCKNGGTCQDASASFVCVCALGWTGPTCETIYTPLDQYTCDFEDGETCIFVDSTQDDFDWSRRSGSTPSSSTGPDNAESGTYYMYTEVSSPRSNGDMARLTTFGTALQPSAYCLSFSYHMKGSPGSLYVFAGDSEQQAIEVWHQSGDQGDAWLTASVDIPAFATPVIIIEGTRGQSYKGDIAIDNLLLNKDSCSTR